MAGHSIGRGHAGIRRVADDTDEPTVVRNLRAVVEHYIEDGVFAFVRDVVESVVQAD